MLGYVHKFVQCKGRVHTSMRVISGKAKGRVLKAVPGKGTRPTTDKVKEAIFSMIGPYFDGGDVLDLFAGTGGLGIEALSRGMERAVFVDADRTSIRIIRDNLRVTSLAEQSEVYCNDANRGIQALARRGRQFHLVMLDPPYRMTNMDELIVTMQELGILHNQCRIVIEHDAAHVYASEISDLILKRYATYGDTAVSIYSREV